MDIAKLLNKLSNPEHYEKLLSLLQDQDFFNPDNYTEEKNPLLANLYGTLSACSDWGDYSESYHKLVKANHSLSERFYNTLDDKQRTLYSDVELNEMSENGLQRTEDFIRGFKFAVTLVVSGLMC